MPLPQSFTRWLEQADIVADPEIQPA